MWIFCAAFCRTVGELCARALKMALNGSFLALILAGNAGKMGVKVDLSMIDWVMKLRVVGFSENRSCICIYMCVCV